MLKYFSTLYAGHILEGDGIGFNGTPANDRWYSNDRCTYAFEIAQEMAQSLEDLGYDILWMAEHHFQREGYECIPNLLMLSVWLSQYTQQIKFGCGFNIPHSIGFSGGQLLSYAEGSSALDFPLIHGARSQDQP